MERRVTAASADPNKLEPSKKHWPRSTSSKHKTRCRDSSPYRLRNSEQNKPVFSGGGVNSRCDQRQRWSGSYPPKRNENSRERDRNSTVFPSRRPDVQSKAVQTENRNYVRNCDSRRNENWNDSSSSSEEIKAVSNYKKRRLVDIPEQSSSCSKEATTLSPKKLRGSRCSMCPSCRASSKLCPCLNSQNEDKSFQEDLQLPVEMETQRMQLRHHQKSPCRKKRENSPARPSSSKVNSQVDHCSVQSAGAESSKDPEHSSSQLAEPEASRLVQEDPNQSTKDSKVLSPVCTDSADKLQRTVRSMSLRNSHNRSNCSKSSATSSEPIVLSSDDEGTSCSEQEASDGSVSLTAKAVYLLQPGLEEATGSKTATKELVSSPSEQPYDGREHKLEQDLSADEVPPLGPKKPPLSGSESSPQKGTAVEIEFSVVHIGRVKGTARGCAMFRTRNIVIPFEASQNQLSLEVDSSQLQGYSLWDINYPPNSSKKHACLLLRIDPGKLVQIQKQLSSLELAQESKCNNFIFLELNQRPNKKQTDTLKKIMAEISERNKIPSLREMLNMNEIMSTFPMTDCDESTYISSLFEILEQSKKDTEAEPTHSAQEKLNVTAEPKYTLRHQRTGNEYSISVAPRPDQQWSEHQHSGPIQKLIVFPPPPAKGGLAVTSEDLECLQEGEFLNDVIIDFYLKYLLLKKAPQDVAERSHIFSSFFYRRLTRKENNSAEENRNLSVQHRRHQRVRTWTRHVDIFTKDFIFVPVNQESHWYLALICFPGLEKEEYEDDPKPCQEHLQEARPANIEVRDKDASVVDTDKMDIESQEVPDVSSSLKEKGGQQSDLSASSSSKDSDTINNIRGKKISKRPCILIMDSLKASSQEYTVRILREYLQIEWEVKRGTPREVTEENMKGSVPRVPKQDNSSDCGLYLLQYVESFLQSPIPDFEFPVHLEKWFPRHVIKNKRKEIRNLIIQLYSEQHSSSSST